MNHSSKAACINIMTKNVVCDNNLKKPHTYDTNLHKIRIAILKQIR